MYDPKAADQVELRLLIKDQAQVIQAMQEEMANQARDLGKKILLCHYDKGEGVYKKISLAKKALVKHLKQHEMDALPGAGTLTVDCVNVPSLTPSISTGPSLTPSLTPSISAEPSLTPSLTPSISAGPSVSLAPTTCQQSITTDSSGSKFLVLFVS